MRIAIGCHKVDFPKDWDYELNGRHPDDVGEWGDDPHYDEGDHTDPPCFCDEEYRAGCDDSVMWWNCPRCKVSYLVRACSF